MFIIIRPYYGLFAGNANGVHEQSFSGILDAFKSGHKTLWVSAIRGNFKKSLEDAAFGANKQTRAKRAGTCPRISNWIRECSHFRG